MNDFANDLVQAWPKIREWLFTTGLKIAVTLAIVITVTLLINLLIKRVLKKEDKASAPEEIARSKRLKTVLGTLRIVIGAVLWVIAGITILGQLGIAIGPIIAGLGVVGIAVGFGAQNLVKDFLAGIFLIVENQLRVGDVVNVEGAKGTVETITLRMTQIRGLNGHLYTIPNGEIKMVENMTIGWSRAIVKVGVGYGSDMNKVIEAMEAAASDIQADDEFGRHVLEPPIIKAIDDFAASSLDIALWITTHPAQQWDIGRKARIYIKQRFDQAGIEIPFPQVTLSPHPDLADMFEDTFAARSKKDAGKTESEKIKEE